MTATRLAAASSGTGLPAGWVSVKDSPYNAVGDNVTDDSTAIQAAITDAKNSASSVAVVYFPPGIYKVGTTLHADNATKGFALVGPEQGAQYQSSPAKLNYVGANNTLSTGGLLTFNSSSGWKLANLGLEYDSTAGFTGHLVQVDGGTGGGDSQDFHITHCTSRARVTNTAASIIRMHRAVIGTIDFCHLTGADACIQYSDTVNTSYVVSVVVEKCTFNFARSAFLAFNVGDGEMLTVRDCVFEAGTNTTAIKGSAACRLYKPLVEGCWGGDASAATVWIDGITTQSNSHVGTVRDNLFFSGGTVSDIFFKMGSPDGANACGAWLMTGNSYLGSGNVFDTYTPGTSFRKVFSFGNSWVSITSVWKSGTSYPATYSAFGNDGDNDITNRLGLGGNGIVETASATGVSETLAIAGGTGAGLNAFATLPGTTKSAVYTNFGASFAPRLTLQAANVAGSEVVIGAGTAPAKTVYVKDANLGFYAATPVAQAARAGQLTDSTGGTVSATLAAGITDGVAKNAIASLAAKVNALETIVHNLGLSA